MVKIRNMAILPPYPYCDVVSVDVNTIGYEQRGIVCSEMVATGAAVRLVTQNGRYWRCCTACYTKWFSLPEDKEASDRNCERNECMISKHKQRF